MTTIEQRSFATRRELLRKSVIEASPPRTTGRGTADTRHILITLASREHTRDERKKQRKKQRLKRGRAFRLAPANQQHQQPNSRVEG